jgi:hypothetical protein
MHFYVAFKTVHNQLHNYLVDSLDVKIELSRPSNQGQQSIPCPHDTAPQIPTFPSCRDFRS